MWQQSIYLQILNAITIILASVFGSLMFYLQKFRPASKYLAIFFFAVVVNMILKFDAISTNKYWHALFFVLYVSSVHFFAPSLFLYFKNLFSPKPFLHKSNRKHLYFPILYFIFLAPIFFKSFYTEKNLAVEAFEDEQNTYYIITNFFMFVVFPILFFYYFSYIYIYIKKYNNKIKNSFSNIDKIQLHLISYMLISFTVCLLSFIGMEIFREYFYGIKEYVVLLFLIHALVVIGIFGLRQNQPFAIENQIKPKEKNVFEMVEQKTEEQTPNYFLSLTQADRESIKKGIKKALVQEKMYRDPQLQLQDIALKVNVSKHHISHILKEELNSNFYQFVNSLRIEEACKLLKDTDYEHYTIEAIAETVGFRSKTTFNKSFKAIIGQTPSVYKQENKMVSIVKTTC